MYYEHSSTPQVWISLHSYFRSSVVYGNECEERWHLTACDPTAPLRTSTVHSSTVLSTRMDDEYTVLYSYCSRRLCRVKYCLHSHGTRSTRRVLLEYSTPTGDYEYEYSTTSTSLRARPNLTPAGALLQVGGAGSLLIYSGHPTTYTPTRYLPPMVHHEITRSRESAVRGQYSRVQVR